ncbi:putative capsid protein [Crucivirus sp.]|nr:putative capsid protein [Crucivirus sp.]
MLSQIPQLSFLLELVPSVFRTCQNHTRVFLVFRHVCVAREVCQSSNMPKRARYGASYRKKRVTKRRVTKRRVSRKSSAPTSKRAKKTSTGRSKRAPSVNTTRHGFTIRHREFVTDITASQSFSGIALNLNPGIASTFPWLSQLAQNFEEWFPKKIVFRFKTTSSDSVVSTATAASLGTVIIATEYNPLNGIFANKQQMENYDGAKSTKPSRSMTHYVNCKRSQNPLDQYFIRTGSVPAGGDQRFYDLGLTQVATVGIPAGTNKNVIGELWIDYEIELKKPKIQIGNPAAGVGACDHIQMLDPTVIPPTIDTTVTPARPFGTATTYVRIPTAGSTLNGIASGGVYNPTGGFVPVLDGYGQPTGVLGPTAANTYYFPPGISNGVYLISYNAFYTTGGASWTPTLAYTNCAVKSLLGTPTGTPGTNLFNAMPNDASALSTKTMLTAIVSITRANASVSFPGSVGAYATPITADLFVVEVPTGMA